MHVISQGQCVSFREAVVEAVQEVRVDCNQTLICWESFNRIELDCKASQFLVNRSLKFTEQRSMVGVSSLWVSFDEWKTSNKIWLDATAADCEKSLSSTSFSFHREKYNKTEVINCGISIPKKSIPKDMTFLKCSFIIQLQFSSKSADLYLSFQKRTWIVIAAVWLNELDWDWVQSWSYVGVFNCGTLSKRFTEANRVDYYPVWKSAIKAIGMLNG